MTRCQLHNYRTRSAIRTVPHLSAATDLCGISVKWRCGAQQHGMAWRRNTKETVHDGSQKQTPRHASLISPEMSASMARAPGRQHQTATKLGHSHHHHCYLLLPRGSRQAEAHNEKACHHHKVGLRQPETVQYWRHCDQRHERSSAAANQVPKTGLITRVPVGTSQRLN